MSGIEKNDRFYYANSEADEKSKSIAERGDVASSSSAFPLQRSQIPPDEGYDPDEISNPNEMSNSDEEYDQGTKDLFRLIGFLKAALIALASFILFIMLLELIFVVLYYTFLVVFNPAEADRVIQEVIHNFQNL